MSTCSELEVLRPFLDVPSDQRSPLLHDRTANCSTVPSLRLNTVDHRSRIPTTEKIDFRVKLLRSLRTGWTKEDTERNFFLALDAVERDGCALFGGLIEPEIFADLVAAYDKVQSQSGNNAFMHSYVNLAVEHGFFLGGKYVEAFSHPLLIALISYLLGGPIRIVDFRGKNNDPMAINAQDNMLHVDNTPFKEEYKVLLNWRRGQVKGPSGQNFTFLPWTHKGNRDILRDEEGNPWSTERESLFVTNEAIDGLFDFQHHLKGMSRVVEARHPEQPLAVLFPAGALVHHRYRTEEGDPRSCIITAFHLSSKHPGQISELPSGTNSDKTLMEFLVGYQDGNSDQEFLSLLSKESCRVEDKLEQLFEPTHPSQMIDIAPLALEGERLAHWRKAVLGAPSPILHKYKNNLRLSEKDFSHLDSFTETLAAVMDYDKHCNLQMILYDDGREEIRKPARKLIGEMKKDEIHDRLKPWLTDSRQWAFSTDDLVEPKALAIICDAIAALATSLAESFSQDVHRNGERHIIGQEKLLMSFSRLMTDLGEAIVRCDGVEAFVVTSLFLFLTSQEIYLHLSKSNQAAFRPMIVVFLRNYVSTVLLVEQIHQH